MKSFLLWIGLTAPLSFLLGVSVLEVVEESNSSMGMDSTSANGDSGLSSPDSCSKSDSTGGGGLEGGFGCAWFEKV